jgi:hypothetical protein
VKRGAGVNETEKRSKRMGERGGRGEREKRGSLVMAEGKFSVIWSVGAKNGLKVILTGVMTSELAILHTSRDTNVASLLVSSAFC